MTDLINYLPKVRGVYRQNAELKNWFDVGGKAEILFRPADIDDLAFFFRNLSKDIAANVLGAGSNIIISDDGVKGVVIRMGGEFAKISLNGDLLTAGAAALCGNVANFCKNEACANLEFFSGIPGSVGGSIAMNAGCYGGDISQFLVSAKAVDYDGNILELKNSDFGFFYRGNKISKKFIFVEGTFKIARSSVSEVEAKISQLTQNRQNSQPIRAKTGGSTFKNPASVFTNKKAWELIDEAGCRGMVIGDAEMSQKHCNFMINRGNASAKDLLTLIERVKESVKNKTGVELETEIKFLK